MPQNEFFDGNDGTSILHARMAALHTTWRRVDRLPLALLSLSDRIEVLRQRQLMKMYAGLVAMIASNHPEAPKAEKAQQILQDIQGFCGEVNTALDHAERALPD